MTTLIEAPAPGEEEIPPPSPPPEDAGSGEAEAAAQRPVAVLSTCAATAFATLAAGWMLAGVFNGALPKLVVALAALAGPAVVLLSYRTSRPALLQYLALPAALLAGALSVASATSGGSANLPSLVEEAVRSGGLGQPPVPFEPGWRFLLVVLLALLGTGAASLGVSGDRPRLAVAVPLPVVIGAALVQPNDSAALNSVVAIVLMVGALTLASGAQLAQEGSSSTRFELRRLLRGALALGVLAAVLVPLSQTGFLFPEATDDRVVPPMRPKAQPPLSDRVLFSVTTQDPKDQGPWRLGVVDGYDGLAWLLPPYDTRRFVDIPGDGDLRAATAATTPGPTDGPLAIPAEPATAAQNRTVTITVGDLPGRVLPVLEGAVQVRPRGVSLQLDPRTQTLRSPDGRAREGARYEIRAAAPADAATLAAAPKPGPELAPYLEIPTAPQDVLDLLARAPQDNAFRRLQFVRNALYAKVVAAGKGEPVDVPPQRVSEMLAGGRATPWEITAAEALLARWAGVPARIGYGFYSGTRAKAGAPVEVHPRDGATWLEAYFPGPGWVTIIGRPPKAQATTSADQKTRDRQIKATDDLALIVHVPVALDDLHQLFESARYWALVSLPWVLLVVLLLVFYPAALKQLRRVRRRRWARARGPDAALLVAYAELRDRLRDVGAPRPDATALEFVAAVEYDDEHWELAWLVTRGLYGDLRRDLRAEDAAAADEMARSVTRRVLRGQRLGPRLLGQANRTSLRDPYTRDIPNVWPTGARVRRARAALRRALRWLDPRRPVRWVGRRLRPQRLASGTSALLVLLGLISCGGPAAAPPPGLPDDLVPTLVGSYALTREQEAEQAFAQAGSRSLVRKGRVFTVRRDKEVLGSIQAAEFLPSAVKDRRKSQEALRASLGSGSFERIRLGSQAVYRYRQGESRLLLWFPPGGGYYELLDAREGFTDAERVFLAVLDYQTGTASTVDNREPIDPRRGGDS